MENEIKKEQEELFRTIYKIATDLAHAGHVAEWDFKSYVLGTMFYRYISENFAAYVNKIEHDAGRATFDYADMLDAEAETAREYMIQAKGFFILPSELFCNVRARADKDENLNETLERVFKNIESSAATGAAENDFAGLFDDFDVNAKAIGETVAKRNKVLVELLNGVAQMPLFSTDGINPDLFGDAYEYLMGMYAANAGKKGGGEGTGLCRGADDQLGGNVDDLYIFGNGNFPTFQGGNQTCGDGIVGGNNMTCHTSDVYRVVVGENVFTVNFTVNVDNAYNCLEMGGLGQFLLIFSSITLVEV